MIIYQELYIIYFISALLFMISIKSLSSPQTAILGNNLGISGMTLSVLATLLVLPTRNDFGILTAGGVAAFLGILWANKIKMTNLPQMIALLNGLGGLASVLVASAELERYTIYSADLVIGIIVGSIAFSGSMIAFLKLSNKLNIFAFFIRTRHIINTCLALAILILSIEFALKANLFTAYFLILACFAFGIGITISIGGADMPIVISLLNSLSGFAASAIGFSLVNIVLIITGAIVGTSGLLLARKMTQAMNRSFLQLFFSNEKETIQNQTNEQYAKTGSPEDAAFLMQNANSIIIVPGYGMAVAGAQYALYNLMNLLETKYHVKVRFAIHPVAGRMPGHMNVLLAEAKIDYNKILSLDEINADFENTDIAYVIGANDITNPAAKSDSSSPLFGMPVLDVYKAKTVFFVKRSLNAGYSGAQNPLFFADNTLMLYGDAKDVTNEIISYL